MMPLFYSFILPTEKGKKGRGFVVGGQQDIAADDQHGMQSPFEDDEGVGGAVVVGVIGFHHEFVFEAAQLRPAIGVRGGVI